MPNSVEILLRRSVEFESALQAEFPEPELPVAGAAQKRKLAAVATILSIEHGSALRAAFEIDAPNSGTALLRLQYEALLRATWLLFAATPDQAAKLTKPLDVESEQEAKNLPSYIKMLEAVQKSGPAGLVQPLAEFNQYSRHALNSFVHTGIHPLSRAKNGFPAELAYKVLLFPNGIKHMAYRLLASLTGEQLRMDRVSQLYLAFTDCLPMEQK